MMEEQKIPTISDNIVIVRLKLILILFNQLSILVV